MLPSLLEVEMDKILIDKLLSLVTKKKNVE